MVFTLFKSIAVKCLATKKTPIVLVPSSRRQLVVNALTSSEYVIDTRPFVLPIAKFAACLDNSQLGSSYFHRTGVKFADAVENMRVKLVSALKNGQKLVFDCFDRVPGFRDKICDKFKVRWFE